MPNGRSRGRRRGRRPKRRSNEKGGRTVQTAAPALFAFMGSLSSSVGLSAWRWACAVPRCGSRCFRNGQRKAIIRTHRLSETGSDYIGLVRVKPASSLDFEFICPPNEVIDSFCRKVEPLLQKIEENHLEIRKLKELIPIAVAKMMSSSR